MPLKINLGIDGGGVVAPPVLPTYRLFRTTGKYGPPTGRPGLGMCFPGKFEMNPPWRIHPKKFFRMIACFGRVLLRERYRYRTVLDWVVLR